MKNLLFFLAIACGIILLPACQDDDDSDLIGNWIRRSDFEGVPRSNAVSFTIGNLAFVGLGFDGDDDLKDFWQYDPEQDFWTRKDTFPGLARRAAVAFAIDGKGYVGTGYNSELDQELKDFWEFDPDAAAGQQWTQISDFPGTARYNAVAFELQGLGYVGTGFDNNWLKDFYAYDPATLQWTQIVSLGGSKVQNGIAFTIDDKAYVGTGQNNGASVFEFWEYDPAATNWTRKLDIDEDDDYTIARQGAVAFTLNGMGYITTGNNGSNISTVWEYLPTQDSWMERTEFEGTSRQDAVGFTVNGRCFVTTGRNSSIRLDDLWEFIPTEAYNEDD
ncbi:MAG: hypothetical protein R2824_29315 [Saprospiraceae bacterium]|nr:hypothetical protein [Lewinella sp.]